MLDCEKVSIYFKGKNSLNYLSGEGEIRTLGGNKYHNGFRDRPVKPLRHLSFVFRLKSKLFSTNFLELTWKKSILVANGYEVFLTSKVNKELRLIAKRVALEKLGIHSQTKTTLQLNSKTSVDIFAFLLYII